MHLESMILPFVFHKSTPANSVQDSWLLALRLVDIPCMLGLQTRPGGVEHPTPLAHAQFLSLSAGYSG